MEPISDFMRELLSDAATMTTADAFAAIEKAEIGVSPLVPLMALMARREEITPRLLAEVNLSQSELEARDEAKPDQRHVNFLHIFAIFLLALFEERQAYQPLVRMLAQGTENSHVLLGDVVTEDLHAVLARICDGSDLTPLKAIIEDSTSDPYVRMACLRSMHAMALLGKLERADVVDYFGHLLDTLDGADNLDFADCLLSAAAGLKEPALQSKITRWLEGEIADALMFSAEEVAADGQRPSERIAEELLQTDHFDSLPVYLSTWVWFTTDDPDDFANDDDFDPDDFDDDQWDVLELRAEDKASADRLPSAPEATFVRPVPKVGRNDPCPCGSGKKYKKCCAS